MRRGFFTWHCCSARDVRPISTTTAVQVLSCTSFRVSVDAGALAAANGANLTIRGPVSFTDNTARGDGGTVLEAKPPVIGGNKGRVRSISFLLAASFLSQFPCLV